MQQIDGYNVNMNDPIGMSSMQGAGDPIGAGLTTGMPDAMAPIGGGGVTPPPNPAQVAQNMGVQSTGIPEFQPVLPPPTISQKLIAAGNGMVAADRQGLPLGSAMGAGMQAYNQSAMDYNNQAMDTRAKQLAEYELMGRIADRHNTELAMQRKLQAGAAFKQAYPQLAAMYDADPAAATKMVQDYYTNNGMSPLGGATGGSPQPTDTTTGAAAPSAPTDASALPQAAPASYAAYRATLPQDTLSYLNSMPPEVQSKALGYASGNVSLPSPRSPTYPAALAMAQKINPNYNEKTVQEQEKVVNDFNTGEAAKKVRAMNTSIYHLGTLVPLIDQIHNNENVPFAQTRNAIGNWYDEQHGSVPISVFNNHADKLTDELATAYGGSGGGTDALRKAQGMSFTDKKGPSQLHANAADTVDLLTGVLKGLQKQYNDGMVPIDKRQPLLTAESAATLKKLGVDVDGLAGATKPSLDDPEKTNTKAPVAPASVASPAPAPLTTGGRTSLPSPKTKAEYDALPAGLYLAQDGTTKRKK